METCCLYPRAYEMMLAFIISFVINNVEILSGSTYGCPLGVPMFEKQTGKRGSGQLVNHSASTGASKGCWVKR